VLFGGGEAVPLRPKTIDDGVIRLGPARVEPLTAAQEGLSRGWNQTLRKLRHASRPAPRRRLMLTP
jgi:hypothetical protein